MTGKGLEKAFKNRILNKVVYFDRIYSTNRYLMSSVNPSGTVAVAREQTNGTGKHGAKWVSGSGGLWFSFVIRKKTHKPYPFVILSSVAVAETLESYGVKPVIKWPNDILAGGKKICGILIENDYFHGRVVAGIGININNTPPKNDGMNAVSLKEILGGAVDVERFFLELLGRLDSYINNAGMEKIIAKWVRRQADLEGKEIKIVKKGKTGKFIVKKVTPKGNILVVDAAGRDRELKGEIFFI